MATIAYTQRLLFIVQTSDKQIEIDIQMNANKLHPIVKPAIIVGICGQTGFVTSFIEHAIDDFLRNVKT